MLYIQNTYTDPYFNLAAEEYLLKNFSDNIFMLWQNEPAVIIGKHQDVWTEVNFNYVQKTQIKVVRRFSGGGAVYHDQGNLNLTFIESNRNPDFSKFTKQIVDFLESIGIHAAFDERQSVTVGGFKISGCAQCIHKGRIMHHATLLFSTNLDHLSFALQHNPQQKKKKKTDRTVFVKSVKSPVTNINVHTPQSMDIVAFKKSLSDYFFNNQANILQYTFNESDLASIRNLRDGKYATTSWNFNTYTL